MKKFIVFIMLMTAATRIFAGQTGASEDSLKAAFVYHFINFTDWNDDLKQYNVCVPDDHELREALEASFKDKVIKQRNIVITDNAIVCHVFIGKHPATSPNVLSIGPLNRGALLEFRLDNNKLRFAANVERIKESKIKVSSQLLKLAILDENK